MNVLEEQQKREHFKSVLFNESKIIYKMQNIFLNCIDYFVYLSCNSDYRPVYSEEGITSQEA